MNQTQLLERAFTLACRLHGSQKRKASIIPGAPYISHLMEVSGMVLANGGSEEEGAAALLHDAIEDVSAEVADEIAIECGQFVLSLVRECTEVGTGRGGEFKAPWKQRKEAYLAHIGMLSVGGLRISVSDKLQSGREVLRQVRIYGDKPYAAFAKKEYATVEERKKAVLWFHAELVKAFQSRLAVLKAEGNDETLLGIEVLVNEFSEVVARLVAC